MRYVASITNVSVVIRALAFRNHTNTLSVIHPTRRIIRGTWKSVRVCMCEYTLLISVRRKKEETQLCGAYV
jgi:hypothetical protein